MNRPRPHKTSRSALSSCGEKTPSLSLLAALLLALQGCDGQVLIDSSEENNRPDASSSAGDMSTPPDMPAMRDIGSPNDMAVASDLSQPPAQDMSPVRMDMFTGQDMPEEVEMPPEMLPCDTGFDFEPSPLRTSAVLTAHFRDDVGHAYIGFRIEGPGNITQGPTEYESGSRPFHWYGDFTVDAGGVYTVSFTRRDGENTPTITVGSCQVRVRADGAPPPIEMPPGPNCQDKVCGDDDGADGKCSSCPMVGSCLDPPSPRGPSPGQTPWSCLDNAGCNEEQGFCVVWCPSEECLYEDSGGCPQNTESCVVPSWVTSYEQACQMCCESRYHNRPGSPGHDQYACWDSNINLCRYPGDCGKPYPQ